MKRAYWRRAGDSLSQALNTLILNGDPDESTSGRSFREGVIEGKDCWYLFMRFIDLLFLPVEKDHCKNAFIYDLERLRERVEQDSKLLDRYTASRYNSSDATK